MYLQVLTVETADKPELINKLQSILRQPGFCDSSVVNFEHIKGLLDSLADSLSFVLEYPYIDKHYRDSYYFYHAAKFEALSRDCIRVHIFESPIDKKDLTVEMNSEQKKRYRGFFIVRPLSRVPLGRSLICPTAFNNHRFLCCLTKDQISLLGNELEVEGFPHVAQDSETHTCAESSLWSLLEYFSLKYQQYQSPLPSQVLQYLFDFSHHRLWPSFGLTVAELVKCLQASGHQCMIYHAKNKSDKTMLDTSSILQIYVESGIPLLIAITNTKSAHALLAIGHKEIEDDEDIPGVLLSGDKTWADVSFFPKKIVFIDDNMPPYNLADPKEPAKYLGDKLYLRAIVAPMPKHVNLDVKRIYFLVSQILNNSHVGLKRFKGKWITRLFLTGSRSFKNALLKHPIKEGKLQETLLTMGFPKYIWVCEIYKADAYKRKRCSGLLIIDATGPAKSLAPVLLYVIEGYLMEHDGRFWLKEPGVPIMPFEMEAYQHNLKGAWNEWVD
jgi:hypothetical protein